MKKTKKNDKKKSTGGWIANAILVLLVVFAVLAYATAKWYINKYGNLGFDSVLYTMFSELNGVESGLIIDYFCRTFVIALIAAAIIIFVLFFNADSTICVSIKNRSIRLYPFSRAVRSLLCLSFFCIFTIKASNLSGLTAYMKVTMSDSEIFNKEYVSPTETHLTFPENKRNLVYIFIESMENTLFDTSHGGAYDVNVVPELYSLAQNNVNFSQNGGWEAAANVREQRGRLEPWLLKVQAFR